jgi:hypothetical protein
MRVRDGMEESPGGESVAREEVVLSRVRKPYQRPAFRYERVFETTALACTKATGGCMGPKKTS